MAQQTVRVLVGAALPRALRIGEEDRYPGLDLEHRVRGQFLAVSSPCRNFSSVVNQSERSRVE
jgi:hypothetical protein